MKADRRKAKPKRVKPIIGYLDDRTAKLDFDGKPLKTTKYWAKRAYNYFKLQGFRILKSSEGNYHIVFDRSLSWKENIEVIDWTALMVEGKQLKNCPLTKYAFMCGIKGVSCLRIGKKKVEGKKEKPRPRTVFKFGKQNNEIRSYLSFRRLLRKF